MGRYYNHIVITANLSDMFKRYQGGVLADRKEKTGKRDFLNRVRVQEGLQRAALYRCWVHITVRIVKDTNYKEVLKFDKKGPYKK
jgi:hypothetical protein